MIQIDEYFSSGLKPQTSHGGGCFFNHCSNPLEGATTARAWLPQLSNELPILITSSINGVCGCCIWNMIPTWCNLRSSLVFHCLLFALHEQNHGMWDMVHACVYMKNMWMLLTFTSASSSYSKLLVWQLCTPIIIASFSLEITWPFEARRSKALRVWAAVKSSGFVKRLFPSSHPLM